jgi:hypothetical protein
METRTIVLGDDGRHVTMGRHSFPRESEIAHAAELLTAQGIGGWLATESITGNRYSTRGQVALAELRTLGQPRASFAEAADAFEARRRTTAAALRPPRQARRSA